MKQFAFYTKFGVIDEPDYGYLRVSRSLQAREEKVSIMNPPFYRKDGEDNEKASKR